MVSPCKTAWMPAPLSQSTETIYPGRCSCHEALPLRQGWQIALLENHAVLPFVPRDDEPERQPGNLFLTGGSTSHPRLVVQRANQRDTGFPNRRELVEQIVQFPGGKLSRLNVRLLFKARQRRLIASRDPQQAVGKDSLRITQMADRFLDRPFTRRIAKLSLFLG